MSLKEKHLWDVPGGPVVRTSLSNAEGVRAEIGEVRSLVEELRSHIPHGQKTKPEAVL